MARKTFDVAKLLRKVNFRLYGDDTLDDLTAEQAYRKGVSDVLEQVLFETGNYKGFGYQESEYAENPSESHPLYPVLRADYDETRRHYFGSTK